MTIIPHAEPANHLFADDKYFSSFVFAKRSLLWRYSAIIWRSAIIIMSSKKIIDSDSFSTLRLYSNKYIHKKWYHQQYDTNYKINCCQFLLSLQNNYFGNVHTNGNHKCADRCDIQPDRSFSGVSNNASVIFFELDVKQKKWVCQHYKRINPVVFQHGITPHF